MNNIFKAKKSIITLMMGILVTSGLTFTPIQKAKAVTFYCANCSTFYQQLGEYAQQVNTALNTADQLRVNIQQYNDMIKQGMQLPNSVFNQITNDLNRVTNVYKEAQSLGRNVSNLDSKFREQYKGYDNYLKSYGQASIAMPDRYKKWASQGFDNARTAMQAAGINTGTFASEDTRLNQLVSRSKTAAGRMQAIQVGNEIAAQNVQQLQKLRDLVATQIQLQGNYMAQLQERQSVDDACIEHFSKGEIDGTNRNKEY